ncbi:MAG TPA: inositol monophosphatase family protein [Actinomycetota bacterium]|nr:inositol monophosphatase family protein [Actinomycetota bacterium]
MLREQLRALAVELATEAGEILLSMGTGGATASKSSPTDLVTEADRAAEDHIFNKLRKLRPDDSIVAEEGSDSRGTSGIEWVVDPLDGTVNYVYGFPHWCVSIGVEGAERLGVIHDPNRRETFADPQVLRPSRKTDLADSLIATGFAYSAETRARQAQLAASLLPKVRDIRRAGSCALDLAWVACGRLDGFYEEGVKRWDISAGIALVNEAGGVARTHGNLTVAAGTPELLERLEQLVLPQPYRS